MKLYLIWRTPPEKYDYITSYSTSGENWAKPLQYPAGALDIQPNTANLIEIWGDENKAKQRVNAYCGYPPEMGIETPWIFSPTDSAGFIYSITVMDLNE